VYDAAVVAIDKDARQVTLSDGSVVQYDALISTMPLDTTLRWLGRRDLAAQLVHSSSHIIGVGLRGAWCVAAVWRVRRAQRPMLRAQVVPPATLGAPAAATLLLRPRAPSLSPAAQPAWQQVLAVLPRGRLLLLPRHRVQQLRAGQLPTSQPGAAHAVPGRRQPA
jgi:hypothetical protein